MGEIQGLHKQINFNNSICYFKSNRNSKNFISFKGPLGFYKNIKDGYTRLKKQNKVKKIKLRWEYKYQNSLRITRKSYQIV